MPKSVTDYLNGPFWSKLKEFNTNEFKTNLVFQRQGFFLRIVSSNAEVKTISELNESNANERQAVQCCKTFPFYLN